MDTGQPCDSDAATNTIAKTTNVPTSSSPGLQLRRRVLRNPLEQSGLPPFASKKFNRSFVKLSCADFWVPIGYGFAWDGERRARRKRIGSPTPTCPVLAPAERPVYSIATQNEPSSGGAAWSHAQRPSTDLHPSVSCVGYTAKSRPVFRPRHDIVSMSGEHEEFHGPNNPDATHQSAFTLRF
jgi:hypothetical protein